MPLLITGNKGRGMARVAAGVVATADSGNEHLLAAAVDCWMDRWVDSNLTHAESGWQTAFASFPFQQLRARLQAAGGPCEIGIAAGLPRLIPARRRSPRSS